MTAPDATPTATDVIAETIHRGVRDGWVYDSPVERSLAMWDPRPTTAAVVAAIRGMDADALAELIDGRVVRRSACCTCQLPAWDGATHSALRATHISAWRAEP